jgi:hypothetical protein
MAGGAQWRPVAEPRPKAFPVALLILVCGHAGSVLLFIESCPQRSRCRNCPELSVVFLGAVFLSFSVLGTTDTGTVDIKFCWHFLPLCGWLKLFLGTTRICQEKSTFSEDKPF